MEIPALYCVLKGGEVKAAPANINGTAISFESEPDRPTYSADELDERMPILVADVKGLNRGEMDDRLLTGMEFRGSDVWFMTHIKDIEDVFDCFMGDVVKVLIPYHTTRNDLVMEEAYEVSENCIPILFASQGRAICRGGQTKDISTAIEGLARTGFNEIAILDTDSLIGEEEWLRYKDRFQGLIPFLKGTGLSSACTDFQKIIVDH
ncbi:MAG: hypothetical protein FWG41_04970 [Methanomassiliicoccaceae archaeon]|nr:hypothetical protein [Methanomassiliicoccaceae archaeon]